jgi:tetratricopeptide (TPR) repeat protein
MIGKRTDYENELERIKKGLAELNGSALNLPVDSAKVSRLAYLQYQRASLTGNLEALADADATLDYAIRHLGPSGDLYFLKANIHFKLHRLNDVEQDLLLGSDLLLSAPGRALKADLDFQKGRYAAAQHEYEALVDEEPSWDAITRLAYLHFKMGDFETADHLYDEAATSPPTQPTVRSSRA